MDRRRGAVRARCAAAHGSIVRCAPTWPNGSPPSHRRWRPSGAADHIARELCGDLDPLAVAAALLPPARLRRLGRTLLCDLHFRDPEDVPEGGEDDARWMRAETLARAERTLRACDIDPQALLAPPARDAGDGRVVPRRAWRSTARRASRARRAPTCRAAKSRCAISILGVASFARLRLPPPPLAPRGEAALRSPPWAPAMCGGATKGNAPGRLSSAGAFGWSARGLVGGERRWAPPSSKTQCEPR